MSLVSGGGNLQLCCRLQLPHASSAYKLDAIRYSVNVNFTAPQLRNQRNTCQITAHRAMLCHVQYVACRTSTLATFPVCRRCLKDYVLPAYSAEVELLGDKNIYIPPTGLVSKVCHRTSTCGILCAFFTSS